MSDTELRLWEGEVLQQWLDYNGHMTEHRYLQVFGESSDALYLQLGVVFERASEGSFFTLETHLVHIAEAHVGTRLWTTTEIVGFDEKRLHLFHRLFGQDGKLLATAEHLALNVAHGKAAAADPDVLARISEIFGQQQHHELPERMGGVLKKPMAVSRLS